MARVLRGYIAKCNEKISKEIFDYEKSKVFNQEYGVLFLYKNLTKPVFFRFDSSTMVKIQYIKENWLAKGEGATTNVLDSPEQSFEATADVFFRKMDGTLTHKTFALFVEADQQLSESSSIHTKNYIHI